MKKSSLIIFAAVAVICTVGCKKKSSDPAPAGPSITVQSVDKVTDAFVIDLTGHQSTNYGTSAQLYTSAWTYNPDPGNATGLIRFDYTDLPAGSTVKKATLTLYADTSISFNSGDGTNYGHYYSSLGTASGFTVKRITSTWSELAVTYTTKPTSVATHAVTAAVSTIGKASQAYTLDVTDLVKDQIANTNYGFEIALVTFQTYNRFAFYSSEGPYANLHPKIVIEY